jgi:hypothetical protein
MSCDPVFVGDASNGKGKATAKAAKKRKEFASTHEAKKRRNMLRRFYYKFLVVTNPV